MDGAFVVVAEEALLVESRWTASWTVLELSTAVKHFKCSAAATRVTAAFITRFADRIQLS